MRAIVQTRYGPPGEVLELRDIERPSVGDEEVLVRVHAAPVAGDDWHLIRGLPYAARMATGLRRPKHQVAGRELAGVVKSVGQGVTRLEPGDEVFGWCDGAFAEYAAVPEQALARKPAKLSFEEAAAVPIAAFTALQGLRDKGELQPGQRVLIVGASGGVGTFAVQIAKSLGAHVTGVCSTANVQMVRSLGADEVIDYTRDDFTESDEGYDLILDMVGNRSLAECRRALRPRGTLVMVGTSGDPPLRGADRWLKGLGRWLKGMAVSPFVRQRLRPLVHADKREDLETISELIETGELTPVITASYPLSEVPEAIDHFAAGHARGRTVITV